MDVLDLPDGAAWERWLDEHAARGEAWLRIGRRGSALTSIGITDALDVALCFGWIDGQRRGLDGVSFLQRYSRRRPRSSWSQVNVGKVEVLTAAGRMRPAGLAAVAAARADGRWAAAYASQATAEVPPDLAAALATDHGAAAAFARLGRSRRSGLLLPLLRARTPAARERVLARAVTGLGAGG